MTGPIIHHPTDETLATYAAGMLGRPRSLVVATHLERCPSCSREIGLYEALGGALLESEPAVPLDPKALEAVLHRLDRSSRSDATSTADDPLSAYALGPWRWAGPGVYRRSVSVPEADGIKVFMLKAAPGTRLPQHKHTGIEWTCVLEGAFEHQFGRYGPGDFDEANETMEHTPTVCVGGPCVCIVALQGRIVLQSWLGRLLQPLVRL